MKLGDLKRQTLMLLDEYSSGGEVTTDLDINYKMNDFFDLAQKDVNAFFPMTRTAVMNLNGDVNDLPGNFRAIITAYRDGNKFNNYSIVGKKLFSKTKGEITISYFANVDTIGQNTPDTYELEVDDSLATCLPFYVASQHLIVDLVVDYGALWNMYLQHRQEAVSMLASSQSPMVRNSFFRG